jgi:hypothetical protein
VLACFHHTAPHHTQPCPADLPREACFATPESRAAAEWGSYGVIDLPMTPTIEYVRALLQTTIEVEHSTIPLYLTTMYVGLRPRHPQRNPL